MNVFFFLISRYLPLTDLSNFTGSSDFIIMYYLFKTPSAVLKFFTKLNKNTYTSPNALVCVNKKKYSLDLIVSHVKFCFTDFYSVNSEL